MLSFPISQELKIWVVSLPSQALPAPVLGHMKIRLKEVLTPNVPDITVVSPEDKHLKHIIDTMALNVLEGGCAFEQAVMERSRGSPVFNFLFELGSKEHTYYVWRLYSLAQGDTLQRWRTEPYIMIAGCGRWIPPPLPATRSSEHGKEPTGEVVEVLTESLIMEETSIPTKVARLKLVSNILQNSSALVIGNNMMCTRTANEEQRAQVIRETIMIEAENETEIGSDEA